MAFDNDLASILTGASIRQLRKWSSENILTPELEFDNKPAWSHRDLIALRTFVYLRNTKSLASIKRALDNMNSEYMNMCEHPSEYFFETEGKDILIAPMDDKLDVVSALKLPGQQRFVTFADIFRTFERSANGRKSQVVDFERPRPLITVTASVMGGMPVAEGTRVPFDIIASMVSDEPGFTPQEISDHFPSVSPAAALDAINLYRVVYPRREVAA